VRWITLLLTLLYLPLQAIETSGYFKTFPTHRSPNAAEGTTNSIDNILRLKASKQFNKKLRGEIAYELFPLIRKNSPPPPSPIQRPQPQSYRVVDLKSNVFTTDDDFFLLQNLDRLFFNYSTEKIDVNVGRQLIAFGSARSINPTDIFTPFTFDTLNKEDRIGVDAIHITIPTGELTAIEAGFVAGNHFSTKQSGAFLTKRNHVKETDITTSIMYFRKNILLGVDIQRPIKQAGFWLEMAYVIAESFQTNIYGNNYFRTTTGLDYKASDKLYIYGEYHFNGPGTITAHDYIVNSNQVAYTQGTTYLLGQHYLIPGMMYEITPLILFNAQLLTNITDPSAYLYAIVEHNIKEDWYYDYGLLLAIGNPRSEFKLYPDVVYLSVRKYF